jgi:hypothetical protein
MKPITGHYLTKAELWCKTYVTLPDNMSWLQNLWYDTYRNTYNELWILHSQILNLSSSISCEIVALRKILLTDWRATIRSVQKDECIFLAHIKTRMVRGIFLHPHTQPAPMQAIKIFIRHLATTFIPSLTLQISDIIFCSLESPTLKFLPIICHIRDLDVWSRGKGKSNFVRIVMVWE